MAKLSLAIARFEKAGYTVKNRGTQYWVVNGKNTINFFENGENTDKVSTFTFTSKTSCAPTHGFNLKGAIEALGPVEYDDIEDASIHIYASGSGALSLSWITPNQDKYWTTPDMRLKHVRNALKASDRTYQDSEIFVVSKGIFELVVPCEFLTIGQNRNYIACQWQGKPRVFKYAIENLAEGQDASDFTDFNLTVSTLEGEEVKNLCVRSIIRFWLRNHETLMQVPEDANIELTASEMSEHIYYQMEKAGVQIDHYQNDLHVPVNETTTAIIEASEFHASKFRCNISKDMWYEIPFAYIPEKERQA